ncbi:hypothetical protein LEP1GSC050_3039 [Leptospira broomii serovar Hurstbridge str. 5399]|uniref:Uncharacterized protein n=1 Tax=Leptospira broomii serovar Hurstbridge str. 5399 TaxID=1049789 RepID=T0FEP4_9LEPT|nr:hypothetical protein LEP1GSC050_3039 [Leptospira broomii serovar Hurstbridge str. 5399]
MQLEVVVKNDFATMHIQRKNLAKFPNLIELGRDPSPKDFSGAK